MPQDGPSITHHTLLRVPILLIQHVWTNIPLMVTYSLVITLRYNLVVMVTISLLPWLLSRLPDLCYHGNCQGYQRLVVMVTVKVTRGLLSWLRSWSMGISFLS